MENNNNAIIIINEQKQQQIEQERKRQEMHDDFVMYIEDSVGYRHSIVEFDQSSIRILDDPVIRQNPITKRNALYLTSLPRCLKLKLSDGTDRSDLIEYLYHFTLSVGQVKRHQWSAGDVIIWDNRCTLHAADHSDVVGSRTLYRGMVRGEKPIPG